jgi:hypothetical protein
MQAAVDAISRRKAPARPQISIAAPVPWQFTRRREAHPNSPIREYRLREYTVYFCSFYCI